MMGANKISNMILMGSQSNGDVNVDRLPKYRTILLLTMALMSVPRLTTVTSVKAENRVDSVEGV